MVEDAAVGLSLGPFSGLTPLTRPDLRRELWHHAEQPDSHPAGYSASAPREPPPPMYPFALVASSQVVSSFLMKSSPLPYCGELILLFLCNAQEGTRKVTGTVSLRKSEGSHQSHLHPDGDACKDTIVFAQDRVPRKLLSAHTDGLGVNTLERSSKIAYSATTGQAANRHKLARLRELATGKAGANLQQGPKLRLMRTCALSRHAVG